MERPFLIGCAVLALIIIYLYRSNTTASNLPPGPKPLPLIGNLLDLPPKGTPEYQHWLKHLAKYGGLSSVSVMGTTMIIIHDIDIAHLLLEKKSGKTSARPVMEFAQDLCGFDQILVMRQYDDSYQSRRKLLHKGIGTKTDSEQYGGIMEAEAKQFIWRLMNSPEQLNQHLNT
jgi:fumagillin biosynthesis cytochrome P450 monooxygenase